MGLAHRSAAASTVALNLPMKFTRSKLIWHLTGTMVSAGFPFAPKRRRKFETAFKPQSEPTGSKKKPTRSANGRMHRMRQKAEAQSKTRWTRHFKQPRKKSWTRQLAGFSTQMASLSMLLIMRSSKQWLRRSNRLVQRTSHQGVSLCALQPCIRSAGMWMSD